MEMSKPEPAAVHTEPPFVLPSSGGVYEQKRGVIKLVEGGAASAAQLAPQPAATSGDGHEKQA